jgi:hypothetical protein
VGKVARGSIFEQGSEAFGTRGVLGDGEPVIRLISKGITDNDLELGPMRVWGLYARGVYLLWVSYEICGRLVSI